MRLSHELRHGKILITIEQADGTSMVLTEEGFDYITGYRRRVMEPIWAERAEAKRQREEADWEARMRAHQHTEIINGEAYCVQKHPDDGRPIAAWLIAFKRSTAPYVISIAGWGKTRHWGVQGKVTRTRYDGEPLREQVNEGSYYATHQAACEAGHKWWIDEIRKQRNLQVMSS